MITTTLRDKYSYYTTSSIVFAITIASYDSCYEQCRVLMNASMCLPQAGPLWALEGQGQNSVAAGVFIYRAAVVAVAVVIAYKQSWQ